MAVVPSPSSSFTLRLAEPGDFDAYIDAFEAVAAEGRWLGAEAPVDRDSRRAGFDQAVAGDAAVLYLADAGGEVVGAIHAFLSGGVVDFGMFVADGCRGGGIGSALLEAIIDWARRQDAHKINLAAWTTNHAAIGLYARYGFRVEGTRRRHYRRRSGALWDSVVMGLILDDSSAGGPGPAGPERPPIVLPDGGITDVAAAGVVLREWHRSDVPTLVALLNPPPPRIEHRLGDWVVEGGGGDPEIRHWLENIPWPYTEADAEEFIAGAQVALTAATGAPLAITVDGAPVGSVGLRHDTIDACSAEIGYWVAAAARGRGIASTAARLLSDFGFAALGLRRVELNAAVENTASRRVAEKAGFEFEGVRRSWRLVGGAPADFAVYSRTSVTEPV